MCTADSLCHLWKNAQQQFLYLCTSHGSTHMCTLSLAALRDLVCKGTDSMHGYRQEDTGNPPTCGACGRQGLVRTLIPEAGTRHQKISGCLPFYLVPSHSFKAQASADVPATALHQSLFHPPCSRKLPQSLLSLVFLSSFLTSFDSFKYSRLIANLPLS